MRICSNGLRPGPDNFPRSVVYRTKCCSSLVRLAEHITRPSALGSRIVGLVVEMKPEVLLPGTVEVRESIVTTADMRGVSTPPKSFGASSIRNKTCTIKMPKSGPQAVLSKMQFVRRATCRKHHTVIGDWCKNCRSRCVKETRSAPFRHCRGAGVYVWSCGQRHRWREHTPPLQVNPYRTR